MSTSDAAENRLVLSTAVDSVAEAAIPGQHSSFVEACPQPPDDAPQLSLVADGDPVTREAGSVGWRRRYQSLTVGIDGVAATLATGFGFYARFGDDGRSLTIAHVLFACAVPLLWLMCCGLNRAYELRFLGAGTFEFERVGRAFLHVTAITAFTAYATKAEPARGFVLVALPLTFALSFAGRYAARKVLHARRSRGAATVPVLAVGDPAEVRRFDDSLQLQEFTGMKVVATCALTPVSEADGHELAQRGIPVAGDVDSIRDAVRRTGVQSVAVISREISGEKLRWISWQLEGTSTDLVVLPGLTEVAGRRMHIQQVGGLPLLYVAQPEFRGMRRVVKGAFDRLLAGVALFLLAPALLMIALLVRVTSHGPVLFRQTRVGKDGKTFRMIKFRSMCNGAEKLVLELSAANEVEGGTLFKIREDPRVTRIGRILRRYSLDELPQLLNVLGGSMSLVGPRPPLPAEVAQYASEVHRRLLVKPGLTGLWQISGRSDLSWEESVRLDLRYVESWSLTLDLIVLAKTMRAVVRPAGAY